MTNRRDSPGSVEHRKDTGADEERLGALLETVQESALRLLACIPRPPSNVRVRVGAVDLEIAWDATATPQDVLPASPSAPSEAPETLPPEDHREHLTSPTVGVFYHAPEPGAPPFVEKGTTVLAGQQVGIIEAMKLMIPVEADRGGVVSEVLIPDGRTVEFGERLIALEPGG